jgi:hypothetical protein
MSVVEIYKKCNVCSLCNKTFATNKTLANHTVKMHGQNNIKINLLQSIENKLKFHNNEIKHIDSKLNKIKSTGHELQKLVDILSITMAQLQSKPQLHNNPEYTIFKNEYEIIMSKYSSYCENVSSLNM